MLSTENFAVKSLPSSTKTWSWCSWTPYIKTKKYLAFLTESFLVTKSLNTYITSKKRLCSTMDLFSVVRAILFNIYKIYKRFFHFWGREWGEVWSFKLQYFKLLCRKYIQNLSNIWDGAFCCKLLSLFK